MYNVVFKTLVGQSCGAITWTSFENKAAFDKWYNDQMRLTYQVAEENVTSEEAVAHCSTTEATLASVLSLLRGAEECLHRSLNDQ